MDGDALLSERYEDKPAREYVYYPGTFEPLALIDGNGQVYYYHNDVNGLPCELTKPQSCKKKMAWNRPNPKLTIGLFLSKCFNVV